MTLLLCINSVLTISPLFARFPETEHQNEVIRQEMSAMGGLYQAPQTFPPPPPSSAGSNQVDSSSMVSWNRPAPQGSSPSRLMGPRASSLPGYQGGMMGNVGQIPAGTIPYVTSSGQSLASYVSPSRPHPSVFFAVSASSVFCKNFFFIEPVCFFFTLTVFFVTLVSAVISV